MSSLNVSAALAAGSVLFALAGTAGAGVRVVHASPDAPNVDVYVNQTPGAASPAIGNLPFRSATGYVPLPTGAYNFQVTPAGQPAPVVINANASIDGATDYSVVATGFLSGIQPTIFVDDNRLNPNRARVRFIHASPDVPTVDIFAAGVAAPLFDAVSFRQSGGYVEVPGGTFDLSVRLDSNGATALSVPGVTLQNNRVYTIFAMGSLQGQNVQAVLVTDAIPTPGVAGTLLGGLALACRRRRR